MFKRRNYKRQKIFICPRLTKTWLNNVVLATLFTTVNNIGSTTYFNIARNYRLGKIAVKLLRQNSESVHNPSKFGYHFNFSLNSEVSRRKAEKYTQKLSLFFRCCIWMIFSKGTDTQRFNTIFFSGTVDSPTRIFGGKNDSCANILFMHVRTWKRRDSSWLVGCIYILPEMDRSHVPFIL